MHSHRIYKKVDLDKGLKFAAISILMEGIGSSLPLEQMDSGEFTSDGVMVKLVVTNGGISWSGEDNTHVTSVEWRDVIRCHKGGVSEGAPDHIQDEGEAVAAAFTVHYVDKNTDNVWKHRWKTFTRDDTDNEAMVATISEKSKAGRPCRLLVLINPVGGRGKGPAQYAKVVAPLFKLTQIDTDVIVSERADHPEELGDSYDFSSVDGVVVVGGDGTLHKLLHTWLPRIQKDAHINISDPGSKLKSLPCPIGMIPTGTGNCLARESHGTRDVETATLHIISGGTAKTALMSLDNRGHHFGFSAVGIWNGLFCDLLSGNHDDRWLGWLRYPLEALFLLFKRRREFKIELEYLPCTQGDSIMQEENKTPNEWKKIEGVFTGIWVFPGVFSPNATSGEMRVARNCEVISLLLEKQCGRLRYFYWMYKLIQFRHDMLAEDFISELKVESFKYRIMGENCNDEQSEQSRQQFEKCIIVDGEMKKLDTPEVAVRIHKDMMEMFGTCPKALK